MFHANVILTPGLAPSASGPLRDGDDVSWIEKCRAGDNQGQTSACSCFAMANFSEIMTGERISDSDTVNAWKVERMRQSDNLDGGLTIPSAWHAANKARWTEPDQRIERVRDLTSLSEAPIIACYQTTKGWNHPNNSGCIRHSDTEATGHHAVLLVAHGKILDSDDPMVWIENSWGGDWGFKGLGCMTEEYHRRYCKELWIITS